jgi:rhomboid protease GluP
LSSAEGPGVIIDPTRLFAERLIASLRPRARVTRALVWVNLGVHLLILGLPTLQGLHPQEAATARDLWTLIVGAKINALIEAGQLWRLFSAVFVHAGLLHLAVNVLSLHFLGRVLEAVFGPARFLLVYLISGLAGSLASLALSDAPSVGASGAIFGVLGGVAVFGFRNRHRMVPALRRQLVTNPLIWIGLNTVAGLAIPRVDLGAHTGGLICGALVSRLLADRIGPAQPRPARARLAVAAAAGLALLASVSLLTGLSQVALGVRYPETRWEPVQVAEGTSTRPAGWREGLPNGDDCGALASTMQADAVRCWMDPFGAMYLIISGPRGPTPGDFNLLHDREIVYQLSWPSPDDPARPAAAVALVAAPFMREVYDEVWRTMPLRP